jgi:hypothetical protein
MYTLNFYGSSSTSHDTHEEAVAAFMAMYPDGDVGHCGDLTSGGERTLCWENPVDADGDDGYAASAEILCEATR